MTLFGDEPIQLSHIERGLAERFANDLLGMTDAYWEQGKIAGSIRRERDYVNDVDLVVECDDGQWMNLKHTAKYLMSGKIIANGEKLCRVLFPFGNGLIQVDFNRAMKSNWGVYMLIRTGSADHNIYLAKLAHRKGMKLEYSRGLIRDNTVVAGSSEEEIFIMLGLSWIHPKRREIVGGKPAWMV